MHPGTGSAARSNTERALSDLGRFGVAPLELIKKRELLTRVDRKFVTTRGTVETFLDGLSNEYRLLRAGTSDWATYETCYFDTPELSAFHEHVRGRRPRFKVRIRHYLDRECSFLEIKRKTNGGETKKARQRRAFRDSTLNEEDRIFVARHCSLPAATLEESVWTNFRRATFVGVRTDERVTVDLDLRFERGGSVHEEQRLGIIEIKQARLSHFTPAAKLLRGLRVQEASMSKYCAAVAEIHPSAKPRAAQTVMQRIERIYL